MLFTNQAHRRFAKDPAVIRFDGQYFLYYSMLHDDDSFGVGIAVSRDMETWDCVGEVTRTQPCEGRGIAAPAAIVLDGQVHLFYQSYGNGRHDAICHAYSPDGFHFEKDPENPVFRPSQDWCCGRAIDADVCVFHNKLYLYFATRDHAFTIQKVGGACAELDSGFGRSAWRQLAPQALLSPELRWEGQCIEAPAALVHKDRIYLFYGGSYNCTPQQIGCAVSDDGIFFRRLFSEPFLPCGTAGSWNSSESGHPYAFRDDNGRFFLFHQGSADMGKTWYLSRREISFDGDGIPCLKD